MKDSYVKKGSHFVSVVVVILCFALVMCGGMVFFHDSDAKDSYDNDTDFTADTVDYGISEEPSAVSGDYHDLTAGGPIAVSGTAAHEDICIFPQRLYTNSCAISARNNTDSTITVYLYNSTNRSDPILQSTVSGHDTVRFTGLTSQYLYYVGFGSGSEQDVQLIISQ